MVTGLWESVRTARTFEPVVVDTDAARLFLAVAQALFWGRRLVLVDGRLTSRELAEAGGMPLAARADVLPSPDCAGISDFVARCRIPGNFELGILTSGSAGLPKLVFHSLEGLTRTLRVAADHCDDVWGLCYNPTHIAGIQVFLQAFFNANRLIDLTDLSPHDFWAMLASENVSHISATPTFLRMVLAECPAPSDGVRRVTVGGERADGELVRRLREAFPAARVRNHYALTESGTLLVSENDVFSIPEALAGSVRIQDGTLWVQERLLGRFEKGLLKDGWYDTGDAVEEVSRSPLCFRFAGRTKEWVNIGGEKVNPREVETILREHPGVVDAHVGSRTNSVVGNVLDARVVLKSGTTEGDIRDFLATRVHKIKIPRWFTVVPMIQRNRNGKAVQA